MIIEMIFAGCPADPERVVYKLCTIIFRCLHQTAPQYLQ